MKRLLPILTGLIAVLALAGVTPALAQGKDVSSRSKVSCSPAEHLAAMINSFIGKNWCKAETNATYEKSSNRPAKSLADNKRANSA
jgi:hypothetical protein